MDKPNLYTGNAPLNVRAETVIAVMKLLHDEGHGAFADKFRNLSAGIGANASGGPAALGGQTVAVDKATINDVKEYIFKHNLQNKSQLAASIIGIDPNKCPPPKFECPHIG